MGYVLLAIVGSWVLIWILGSTDEAKAQGLGQSWRQPPHIERMNQAIENAKTPEERVRERYEWIDLQVTRVALGVAAIAFALFMGWKLW